MAQVPVRYWSVEQDSARWLAFEPRPGDIVISTRSKHGTSWMQMICALLIFQNANCGRRWRTYRRVLTGTRRSRRRSARGYLSRHVCGSGSAHPDGCELSRMVQLGAGPRVAVLVDAGHAQVVGHRAWKDHHD